MKKKLQKALIAIRTLQKEYQEIGQPASIHFKGIADDVQNILEGKEDSLPVLSLEECRVELYKLCAEYGTTVYSFDYEHRPGSCWQYSLRVHKLFSYGGYASDNYHYICSDDYQGLKLEATGFLKNHALEYAETLKTIGTVTT